jgi:general secretion pathway protein D
LPAVATLTGILTDPQFRMVVRALEQRSGVDLLSAPRVTTLSGRQTQIAVVDVLTVVAGVQAGNQNQNQNQNVAAGGFTQQNNASANINYDTQPLPFGPVLDVIPYVSADGYTIQMTIIPTLTEFIGYDTDTAQLFVPQVQIGVGSSIGTPVAARLPLPILRSRQLVTSCTVWDGQTVMLGGLIAESVSKIKDKVPVLGDIPLVGRFFRSESRSSSKKNLVIFVTPTIIDPAGNRVHTDAELPYSDPSKVLPTF